ncbi:MAG: AAA family ATPase [Thermoplasmata archaeon]|nr:AAA family ATPase [Thermoplasmata archaeon]
MKRLPTGVDGFDDLIDGGYPEGSVNLISGPTGSAKSLFCLHYVYSGVSEYGEPSLYITLEEKTENLRQTLMSFGMNPTKYETDGSLTIVDLGEIRKLEGDADALDFRSIEAMIDGLIETNKVKRLVVDSIAVIGLQQKDVREFRKDLFQFGRFLGDKDTTSVLVTECSEKGELTRFGVEQFITDSFVFLGLDNVKGELRRTVVVRKMRLTHHDTAVHPFLITGRGIRVSSDVKVSEGR